MIRKGIAGLLLALPVWVAAQSGDSVVNYTDINGMKQGYWIKKDGNNQKVYEGYFKNNVPYGTMKRYHSNGKLKALMVYNETDQKQITVTYYDDSGELGATGFFKNGQRDSVWKFFGEHEKLLKEEHYKAGKLNGICKIFYPSGKILEERAWKEGKQNGFWTRYWESGQVRMKANHVNNERTGDFLVYWENGKVEIKGKYTKDVKDGEWVFSNDQGKVEKTLKFKDGLATNETEIDRQFTKDLEDAEKNQQQFKDPANYVDNPASMMGSGGGGQ